MSSVSARPNPAPSDAKCIASSSSLLPSPPFSSLGELELRQPALDYLRSPRSRRIQAPPDSQRISSCSLLSVRLPAEELELRQSDTGWVVSDPLHDPLTCFADLRFNTPSLVSGTTRSTISPRSREMKSR
jgi:hypothetical protein